MRCSMFSQAKSDVMQPRQPFGTHGASTLLVVAPVQLHKVRAARNIGAQRRKRTGQSTTIPKHLTGSGSTYT